MKIERFGKQYDLKFIAFYKKGKKGKLSKDNLRVVLEDVGDDLFNTVHSTGKILCGFQEPKFDKNMFGSSRCAVTNLPMSKRPECIGDLEVMIEIDVLDDVIKNKSYNYYKLDENDPEIQIVLGDVINSIECFK